MSPLVEELRAYLAERNWLELRPSDISKSISIEAAELLELFQWIDCTVAELKDDPERLTEVKKELGDVLIYCLEMCVILDLDPEEVVRMKLALAAKKYPADVVKQWKRSSKRLADDPCAALRKTYRDTSSS